MLQSFGEIKTSWRVELTCGTKSLREVPIKKGIFQGDVLSLLLFVIAFIPPTHIPRTANPGYEFQTGEINHLLFMDDFKLYFKSERDLDYLIQAVIIFNEDIGMQLWINKCAISVIKMGEIVKSDVHIFRDSLLVCKLHACS